MLNEIMSKSILGNNVRDYLTFILIFLVGIIAIRILRGIVLKRLKKFVEKTKTKVDDFMVSVITRKVVPLLYFGVFYVGVKNLALNPGLEKIIRIIGVALLTVFVVQFVVTAITFILKAFWTKKRGAAGEEGISGMLTTVNILVWAAAVIFFLDNIGFKISTVLAGLGIGGVAIALAAQALLGDLFSYFAIFFDRPFEIGDFIIVGDLMGVVEHIGVKTTRIRSLGGEQLIFSNNDLTNSRVKNYKRMEKRRVVFKFGVTYETPLEKLKEIPSMVKKTVESIEDAVFDRAHFASYGDFSLLYEVVYYVIGGDYNKYMDIQQNINLSIKEGFEKRKIDFAYPTQLVYVNKQ